MKTCTQTQINRVVQGSPMLVANVCLWCVKMGSMGDANAIPQVEVGLFISHAISHRSCRALSLYG